MSSTLKELRELAKKIGLRGYSKLGKIELSERLESLKTAVVRAAAPAPKPPTTPRKRSRARAAKPAARAPAAPRVPMPPSAATPETRPAPAPVRTEAGTPSRQPSHEERAESAKFARYAHAAAVAPLDLGEDIDRLPALTRSTLCVLPQKPGVLHAYWALTDGDGTRDDLKLRLCHGSAQALEVWSEVAIPARRGHWYFHVPETTADDAVLLQLGYYQGANFITAIRRGIARIPNLYASNRTDRWWWIDEASFRAMYLRAGGHTQGGGLGWSASIGSPSAPRPERQAEESLAWPGGVSSRFR